jgi:hypothetical protein
MKFNPEKQKNHCIQSMEHIQDKVQNLRTALLYKAMESADGVIEVMKYLDQIETEVSLAEKYINNLSQCVLTSPTP